MQGARIAQPARDKLAEAGVGVHEAVNGVFLPAMRDYIGPAASHLTLHTQRYYTAVNQAVANVNTREEMVAVLQWIGESLRGGTFPR